MGPGAQLGGGALALIHARRSCSRLDPPAPGPAELRRILAAACAAPDHGTLRPWRFVVLEGEAKDRFGEVLEQAYVQRCEGAGRPAEQAACEKERTKLGRAPLVVVTAAVRHQSDRIPWEEQLASAAAATQNLLLAAAALGYGSMWRTGDPAYDPAVKTALGLGAGDAIVGFVYLGTPAREPKPRPEPDLDALVHHWEP